MQSVTLNITILRRQVNVSPNIPPTVAVETMTRDIDSILFKGFARSAKPLY